MNSHLNQTEKQKEIKSKQKEGRKVPVTGVDTANRKPTEKINETKTWIFAINNTDKPLTKQTKKKGEKTQMTRSGKEEGSSELALQTLTRVL